MHPNMYQTTKTANFVLDPTVAFFFQAKSPTDESKRCDTDQAKEPEVERSPPSKDKRSLYRKTKGVNDSASDDVIPSTPNLLDTTGLATNHFFTAFRREKQLKKTSVASSFLVTI